MRLWHAWATPSAGAQVVVRAPAVGHAAAMGQLARQVDLDANSDYCYLLFCRDFADTSVVALDGDQLAGFITAYRRPGSPGTLFVWQVGVAHHYQGRGIAGRMLAHLYETWAGREVTHVEATVTPGNAASIGLFSGFARQYGMELAMSVLFPAEAFAGNHPEEVLLRMGPPAATSGPPPRRAGDDLPQRPA